MARRRTRRTKSKKKLQEVLDVEPIPCEFLKRTEWSGIMEDDSGKTKFGRYHQSFWHDVKQFGSKRWVVGCYIIISEDINALIEQGSTEEEIAQGCIKFLNQPPPRKKYQRNAEPGMR